MYIKPNISQNPNPPLLPLETVARFLMNSPQIPLGVSLIIGGQQKSHQLGWLVLHESKVVEVRGIEPLAPCLQSRCSPAELHPHGIYA